MQDVNVEDIIKKMNISGKRLRREAQDIVIYSQGSFSIKELYQLPYYQIQEILEAFMDKQKKEKEALDAAKGKNTKRL